ncbi:MAG TPA: class II aldolase/adducin family protein [Acidimicrobiales bacterium]
MTAVETAETTAKTAETAGTAVETVPPADLQAFAAETARVAAEAFRALRDTGVLSPSATVQINERVPGHDKVVGVVHPNPWRTRTPQVRADVFGFDGTPYLGDPAAARGARRFAAAFERHADITTVVHVHTPYLGAWAQVHRALPVTHGGLRRVTDVPEIPVYIDRRQAEVDFILEQIDRDRRIRAIVEANGGGTVWGRDGLAETVAFIQVLEQAARATALAETLGVAADDPAR